MADHLVRTLQGMHDFVTAQAAAGQDITSLRASQKASIIRTLTDVTLDYSGGGRVTTAICSGHWTQEDKNELLQCVANRTSATKAMRGQRRESQECLHFETFIPLLKWANLENTAAGMTLQVGTVVEAAHCCGLVLPNEKTIARMLAVVCAVCLRHTMNDSQLFMYFTEFKALVRKSLASKPQLPFALLNQYPATPAELPEAIKAFAYGTAGFDAEYCKKHPAISTWYESIPLRNSNTKISSSSRGRRGSIEEMVSQAVTKAIGGRERSESHEFPLQMLGHKPPPLRRCLTDRSHLNAPGEHARGATGFGRHLALADGPPEEPARGAEQYGARLGAQPGLGPSASALAPPGVRAADVGDHASNDGSVDSLERRHLQKLADKKAGKPMKTQKPKGGHEARGEALRRWREAQAAAKAKGGAPPAMKKAKPAKADGEAKAGKAKVEKDKMKKGKAGEAKAGKADIEKGKIKKGKAVKVKPMKGKAGKSKAGKAK